MHATDTDRLYEEVGESEIASERARPIAAGTADERLIDAMARLFDLVGKPLEQKVLVPLLTREIHLWMLLAAHGEMLRTLSWRDSHASRIARAIARIRASFPVSISVAELARTAAMSPSSSRICGRVGSANCRRTVSMDWIKTTLGPSCWRRCG